MSQMLWRAFPPPLSQFPPPHFSLPHSPGPYRLHSKCSFCFSRLFRVLGLFNVSRLISRAPHQSALSDLPNPFERLEGEREREETVCVSNPKHGTRAAISDLPSPGTSLHTPEGMHSSRPTFTLIRNAKTKSHRHTKKRVEAKQHLIRPSFLLWNDALLGEEREGLGGGERRRGNKAVGL